MKLTLIRKLARVLNGVDLTACHEGDVIEMPDRDARVLIAEGWAVAVTKERPTADDRPRMTGRGGPIRRRDQVRVSRKLILDSNPFRASAPQIKSRRLLMFKEI